MHNSGKHRKSNKHHERNHQNCLTAIYAEICADLVKRGWNPEIKIIREFTCIHISNLSLSAFISDGILFVVKGSKLPPLVYQKNLSEPEFGIVDFIDEICRKLFTSPEKLFDAHN